MADTDTIPALAPQPVKPVTDAAIWQAIATATHHGVPAPSGVGLFETSGRRHLILYAYTLEDGGRWVDWLDLENLETQIFEPSIRCHGFTDYTGGWGGWRWTIRCRSGEQVSPARARIPGHIAVARADLLATGGAA